MSRSNPQLAAAGVYGALLARIVPRLEELLASRLDRLETKIVAHEAHTELTGKPGRNNSKRPLRATRAGLSPGRPSVVVVGARLRSDQRFCWALIQRVVSVIAATLQRS